MLRNFIANRQTIQSFLIPLVLVFLTLTPSGDVQITNIDVPENLTVFENRIYGLPFNLIFAITSLLLLTLLLTLSRRIYLLRIDYLIIVLILTALFSQIISLYPDASLVWNLKLLFGIFCYFIFAHVVNLPKIIKPFTVGILLAVIIQLFFITGQFFNQETLSTIFENPANIEYRTVRYISDGITYFRPVGTFSHPNILSAFLALALPILLYLIITNRKSRYYLLAVLLLIIISLLLTLSTFGLITFIFSGTLFLLLTKFKVIPSANSLEKISLTLSLSIIVLIPLIASNPNFFALYNPLSDTYFPFETRRNLIIQAIHTIKNNPFGIGPGSFPLYFLNNDVTPLHLSKNILYSVHNTLLLITSELGVQGLIIFLLIFAEIIRIYIKSKASGSLRLFQTALFCGLMSFYFNGLFEPRNIVGKIGTLYWIFLGIFAQLSHYRSEVK